MPNPQVPNFGSLLAPAIAALPEQARPAALCGLERAAAARYRFWAEQLPEHAVVLLACAAREEEIADLVEGLFPLDAIGRETVDKAMPAMIAIFLKVFESCSVLDQIYVQSEAELQGAAAWANIAESVDDPTGKKILARCSALEEESSRAAKGLLAARD